MLGDSEVLARLAQLSQSRQRDTRLVVPVIPRLDAGRAVSEFAVGTGDDDGLNTLVGVGRQDAACARGFIVWVGMNCHQGQWVGHRCNLLEPAVTQSRAFPEQPAWRTGLRPCRAGSERTPLRPGHRSSAR